jgi:hypothetical protein
MLTYMLYMLSSSRESREMEENEDADFVVCLFVCLSWNEQRWIGGTRFLDEEYALITTAPLVCSFGSA